jgi:predicted NUDIX family NTP pyrophosphohydrolase
VRKRTFAARRTRAPAYWPIADGGLALEVLLIHPGGPYWRNKDDGFWSIPKGEIGTSEDAEQAARREFTEELRPAAKIGTLQALGKIRQRGGKRVIAFCEEGDSTQPRCLAISLRWNGRPRAANSRPSRRWIAPSRSTWRPHGPRF